MARGLDALAKGDGATLVAALRGAKDKVRMLRVLGGAADNRRWDVRTGRAVLDAADYILEQPVEHIERFLPVMAIAAAREHQYDAAAKRERAAEVLAKLKPLVTKSASAADLVARSAGYALGYDYHDVPPKRKPNAEAKGQARDLYELVRGCPLLAKNVYYQLIARHYGK